MGQIPPEVQKAILGNAGTLITFAIGADDADVVHKEFAEVFEKNNLVNLSNFQIAVRLMVDWQITRPFLATTLPLPASKNQNREKIIKVSRERWAKKTSGDENTTFSQIPSDSPLLTDEPEVSTNPGINSAQIHDNAKRNEDNRLTQLKKELVEQKSNPVKESKKLAEVLYENPERK
jgi:hypothetical protein